MNRLISASLMTALLSLAGTTMAPAQSLDDAYRMVEPPQPTMSDAKIEVIEFFWYGCPHCYAFEPYLANWLKNKPADVEFRRVPAVLNKSWIPHARAYYAAEKLGVLQKIHTPLFDALHKERRRIYSESELRDFFIQYGVDGTTFDTVYGSNEVDTRIKQAFLLAQNYKVTGVPTIIVNGKYMVNGTLARSFENMIKATDMLIERERAATAAAH